MIDIQNTTIAAVATASGGALSVIRLSGVNALEIMCRLFKRPLLDRTATLGTICDQERVVDEVVATYFQAPRSYTGQDCVEISCHGSAYVTSEILRLLIASGAVMATAGEFTLRAFMNGKLDLSQAEAVADLIASNSRSSADVALRQMRGGYSLELKELSNQLLDILSLLELELDFGEEDVEFADRAQLSNLISKLNGRVVELAGSFRLGNVLKNGIPVAIVGKPNVGKSTLLNRLLGEERAIVSSTPGTTRDFIEQEMSIDGICFRFIDTAGLRDAEDEIERLGIERSYEKLNSATIVLQMVDSSTQAERLDLTPEQTLIVVRNKSDLNTNVERLDLAPEQTLIVVRNKSDLNTNVEHDRFENSPASFSESNSATSVSISAKYGIGISELKEQLLSSLKMGEYDDSAIIVSNVRHYEALMLSGDAFELALAAITRGDSTELISAEIRTALLHLGEITGEITTDDILGNIFSKFCIGK